MGDLPPAQGNGFILVLSVPGGSNPGSPGSLAVRSANLNRYVNMVNASLAAGKRKGKTHREQLSELPPPRPPATRASSIASTAGEVNYLVAKSIAPWYA
jgi:hypothetical protein